MKARRSLRCGSFLGSLFASGALAGCSSWAEPRLEASSAIAPTSKTSAAGAARRSAAAVPEQVRPVSGDGGSDFVCDRTIDDFTRGTEGSFPEGWETHPASGLGLARREGMYRVVEHEGRRVLHARSGSEEITLGIGVADWDLERYPILEWEWKAVTLPEGADESRSDSADTAAAVTAVWMIGLPFVVRRLSYTYSSTLPAGSRVASRFGYDQALVVDGRGAERGQWRRVRVNLLENYRALFERKDSEPPTGIALTTDAGDTVSRAEAYYANVRLCRPLER